MKQTTGNEPIHVLYCKYRLTGCTICKNRYTQVTGTSHYAHTTAVRVSAHCVLYQISENKKRMIDPTAQHPRKLGYIPGEGAKILDLFSQATGAPLCYTHGSPLVALAQSRHEEPDRPFAARRAGVESLDETAFALAQSALGPARLPEHQAGDLGRLQAQKALVGSQRVAYDFLILLGVDCACGVHEHSARLEQLRRRDRRQADTDRAIRDR